MDKLETLTSKVKEQYDAKHEGRADWADWMYDNHVSVVTRYGYELSERFAASKDIVVGACLVHDIADTVMDRFGDNFASRSLEIAERLLTNSGFTDEEKEVILGEILPNHSCREGDVIKSLEGKVMATADALAHFNTDFYFVALYKFAQKGESMHEIREWALKKLDKDFYRKIFFKEVREETQGKYNMIKEFFSVN